MVAYINYTTMCHYQNIILVILMHFYKFIKPYFNTFVKIFRTFSIRIFFIHKP